jgi:hypothetical protein
LFLEKDSCQAQSNKDERRDLEDRVIGERSA